MPVSLLRSERLSKDRRHVKQAGPRFGKRGDLERRLAQVCLDLPPWRRRIALAIAGGLAAFALPPFNWVPVLVPSFVFLLVVAGGERRRRSAFGAGWWWGFGHFLAGDYWIANSFMIDPIHFGWMIPIIIPGLSAYLAIYCGLAVMAAWHWRHRPLSYVLALAAVWPATEWLRGHVLTGYPWNLIAYSWSNINAMMQSAAWWGSWGLGAITVLLVSLPALFLMTSRRVACVGLLCGVVILWAIWGAGVYRLAAAGYATVAGTKLRLVQPAIPQLDKMMGLHRTENFVKHLRMSIDEAGFDHLTAVIWPESAAPPFLERFSDERATMTMAVPRAGTPAAGLLIAGSVRGQPLDGDLDQVWNSLVVLNGEGRILATADKFHLVPLGEYVPLRSVFPFINKLTPGSMNFSTADGPQTVHVPGLPPFGALICYEVIFPGAVTNAADRPNWLLNITNDGWFGTSTGPYQHFASARFRAVEEGIPLIRAANTGITAEVDSYGRIIASLPLGAANALDVDLPEKLQSPTLFTRFGVGGFILLSLVMSACGYALTYWRDNRNDNISQ